MSRGRLFTAGVMAIVLMAAALGLLTVAGVGQLAWEALGEPPMDPPYWPFGVVGAAMLATSALQVWLLRRLALWVGAPLGVTWPAVWLPRLAAEAAAWLCAFPFLLWLGDIPGVPRGLELPLPGGLLLMAGLAAGRHAEPASLVDQVAISALCCARLMLWALVPELWGGGPVGVVLLLAVVGSVELLVVRLRADPAQRLVSGIICLVWCGGLLRAAIV